MDSLSRSPPRKGTHMLDTIRMGRWAAALAMTVGCSSTAHGPLPDAGAAPSGASTTTTGGTTTGEGAGGTTTSATSSGQAGHSATGGGVGAGGSSVTSGGGGSAGSVGGAGGVAKGPTGGSSETPDATVTRPEPANEAGPAPAPELQPEPVVEPSPEPQPEPSPEAGPNDTGGPACLATGDDCTSTPNSCCSGICFGNASDLGMHDFCSAACTANAGCNSGCCATLTNGQHACGPRGFCPDTCAQPGTACTDTSDCCRNEWCVNPGTGSICATRCVTGLDCASGCCVPVNGVPGVQVCAPVQFCQ